MRKRRHDKHIFLSDQENERLAELAEKTCLTESELLRKLLMGFVPKEKPDGEFYHALRELTVIGNNLHQLLLKANALNFIDVPMLEREAESWQRFRMEIMRKYIQPDKAEEWQ